MPHVCTVHAGRVGGTSRGPTSGASLSSPDWGPGRGTHLPLSAAGAKSFSEPTDAWKREAGQRQRDPGRRAWAGWGTRAHAAPPRVTSPALLQARGPTGHSAQDWGTTGAPLGRNAGLSVAVRWRLGLGDPGTPWWCQHQRSRCSHPPEPNGPQTTTRHTLDHQVTGPGTVATIKSPSECPGEQATQSGVSPPRVRAGWFLVDPASLSSRVHEATGLGSALGRSGSGRGPPLRVARRPHSS